MILNIYSFKDGSKAYFFDNDKIHHIFCPADKNISFDRYTTESITKVYAKQLKGTYNQWKSRIQRGKKK